MTAPVDPPMKRFKPGDWVIICGTGKAHYLVQGYDTPTMGCTPNVHRLGFTSCAIIEQEEMSDGSNAEKCKRCIAKGYPVDPPRKSE